MCYKRSGATLSTQELLIVNRIANFHVVQRSLCSPSLLYQSGINPQFIYQVVE